MKKVLLKEKSVHRLIGEIIDLLYGIFEKLMYDHEIDKAERKELLDKVGKCEGRLKKIKTSLGG